MGLVEYEGLLMEEEVVKQLRFRQGQGISGDQNDGAARNKQAAEFMQDTKRKQVSGFMQDTERKQISEFMQDTEGRQIAEIIQGDISKGKDINRVNYNCNKAVNARDKNNVCMDNSKTFYDRDNEEDDYMREYKVNGVLILACDNGYGNTKGAHVVFRTSVDVIDTPPTFSKDYLEHKGKYYILSEGHKSFVADKVMDDDTYILTLATLAKELKIRGLHEAKIHLAVGLPLKWVKAQREAFKQYMLRERFVDFKYKEERYKVEIVDCTVMPQYYAAVAEKLKEFKGMNLLVDIGNGTMNLMYLNEGRAAENKSWTEKFGINQCDIRIRNAVRDKTGTEMPEDVVENFLRTGKTDIEEPYASIMVGEAEAYVQDIFGKLKDYEYNEKLMKLHFMGGGARIVEALGKYDPDRTFFIHDICATAKGYEYYCFVMLRKKAKQREKQ